MHRYENTGSDPGKWDINLHKIQYTTQFAKKGLTLAVCRLFLVTNPFHYLVKSSHYTSYPKRPGPQIAIYF